MTSPDTGAAGRAWRLTWIGLLAIGMAAAMYVAGRLHQPDYAFACSAWTVPGQVALATIALALAGVQVLLALWMYRKLPRPPARRARCGWCTG